MVRPIGGDDGLPVTNTAFQQTKEIWEQFAKDKLEARNAKDTRGRAVMKGQSGQVISTSSRLKTDKKIEDPIQNSLNSIQVSKDQNIETPSTIVNNKRLEQSNNKIEYSGHHETSTVSDSPSAQVEDTKFTPEYAAELLTKADELAFWFPDKASLFNDAIKIAEKMAGVLEEKLSRNVDFDARLYEVEKQKALTELKKAEDIYASESIKIFDPIEAILKTTSSEIEKVAERIRQVNEEIDGIKLKSSNSDENSLIDKTQIEQLKIELEGLKSDIKVLKKRSKEEYEEWVNIRKKADDNCTDENYAAARSNYVELRANYLIAGLKKMDMLFRKSYLDQNGHRLTKGLGGFLDKMEKANNLLRDLDKVKTGELPGVKLDSKKVLHDIEELLEYTKEYGPIIKYLIN